MLEVATRHGGNVALEKLEFSDIRNTNVFDC